MYYIIHLRRSHNPVYRLQVSNCQIMSEREYMPVTIEADAGVCLQVNRMSRAALKTQVVHERFRQ